MRLSERAKTEVRPLDFWIAVAVATLLIVAICTGATTHWHSKFWDARWLWSGWLVFIWAAYLFRLFQYGCRVLAWQNLAYMAGCTLFAVGHLWHPRTVAASWASEAGVIVIMALTLSSFFVFGKRDRSNLDGPQET